MSDIRIDTLAGEYLSTQPWWGAEPAGWTDPGHGEDPRAIAFGDRVSELNFMAEDEMERMVGALERHYKRSGWDDIESEAGSAPSVNRRNFDYEEKPSSKVTGYFSLMAPAGTEVKLKNRRVTLPHDIELEIDLKLNVDEEETFEWEVSWSGTNKLVWDSEGGWEDYDEIVKVLDEAMLKGGRNVTSSELEKSPSLINIMGEIEQISKELKATEGAEKV